MCILFVHINSRPTEGSYRLILASNRDEYYIRKAGQAAKWSDDPCIISGVDLEPGREGGTWLGLAFNGSQQHNKRLIRVGALLNVTGEVHPSGAVGRGFIVTDFLKNMHVSPQQYLNCLQSDSSMRNAFNFVALEFELDKEEAQVYHYSNMGNCQVTEYEQTSTLAFGNSLPEKPLNKVQAGRDRFEEIISQYGRTSEKDQLIEKLLQLLRWEQRHLPDPELQRRAPDAFEYLSSVFVQIPAVGYGTRTHTIILVDWQGDIHYVEHTMDCPIDPLKPHWLEKQFTARL